jgi:hypothetical protein
MCSPQLEWSTSIDSVSDSRSSLSSRNRMVSHRFTEDEGMFSTDFSHLVIRFGHRCDETIGEKGRWFVLDLQVKLNSRMNDHGEIAFRSLIVPETDREGKKNVETSSKRSGPIGESTQGGDENVFSMSNLHKRRICLIEITEKKRLNMMSATVASLSMIHETDIDQRRSSKEKE